MLFIDGSEIQRGETFVGLSHRPDQFRLLFDQCSIIIQIREEALQSPIIPLHVSLSLSRSLDAVREIDPDVEQRLATSSARVIDGLDRTTDDISLVDRRTCVNVREELCCV